MKDDRQKWCEPCGRYRAWKHEKCPFCGGALSAERTPAVAGAAICSANLIQIDLITARLKISGKFTEEQVVKIIHDFVAADAANKPPRVFNLKSDHNDSPNDRAQARRKNDL